MPRPFASSKIGGGFAQATLTLLEKSKDMTRYANLGGDSGIASYDLGAGNIVVHFQGGSAYRYTNASAGTGNIAEMRRLASAGRGLNSFINTQVKYGYESKLR